jgi:hypothetical protein
MSFNEPNIPHGEMNDANEKCERTCQSADWDHLGYCLRSYVDDRCLHNGPSRDCSVSKSHRRTCDLYSSQAYTHPLKHLDGDTHANTGAHALVDGARHKHVDGLAHAHTGIDGHADSICSADSYEYWHAHDRTTAGTRVRDPAIALRISRRDG